MTNVHTYCECKTSHRVYSDYNNKTYYHYPLTYQLVVPRVESPT